jgi:hypothetical protein
VVIQLSDIGPSPVNFVALARFLRFLKPECHMLTRRPFAIVSSLCLLSTLFSEVIAQQPSADQAATVRKLEAAGAKVLYREGKVFRVSFRGTNAGGQSVLPVVELKQILSLDLTDCSISDSDLKGLVPLSLGQIQLAGTAITDAGMEHLAKMKTLALVNVEGTKVGDDGLAKLVTLPQLGDLWINDTQVTDAGLRQLSSAPNIWRLSIGGASVSDASLKHLTGLKKLSSLWVKSSAVSDVGLRTLITAPILRQVMLYDSQVTQQTIDQLKKTRPNLKVTLRRSLGLPATRTTPRTTSNGMARPGNSASPHRNPQRRATAQSTTKSATPAVSQQEAIEKLKSFGAELELRDGFVVRIEFNGDKSHLGDADFSFLPSLTSLENLELSQTSVTDDLLKQLGRLPRLKTVWLYQTDVTWIGITELEKQIPNLKVYATPPNSASGSWVGWWILAVAFPIFLFIGFSFLRGFFSQSGHAAQLSADVQSGKQLGHKSRVSDSGSRAFYNAAMGFGTFFMLIGGSFLVTGTAKAIKTSSTTGWPTVEGEVVVSRVIRSSAGGRGLAGGDSTHYAPVIVYHYEVDGTKHTSGQVGVANYTAKTIDLQFPIGPVTVHYNPDDSADAVLLTGLASVNFISIGLGGAATLIGVVIFLFALVKRRRIPVSKSESSSRWKFSVE